MVNKSYKLKKTKFSNKSKKFNRSKRTKRTKRSKRTKSLKGGSAGVNIIQSPNKELNEKILNLSKKLNLEEITPEKKKEISNYLTTIEGKIDSLLAKTENNNVTGNGK